MANDEDIIKQQCEQLGFNYEKMLPKMYVKDHAYVLMDAEWIGQAGPDQIGIIFTLIVCTPVILPPFIAMVKAGVKKASDIDGGYVYKKEYWFSDSELPTRKELIEQMTSSLKFQNILEKFNKKDDSQHNSKSRKL